MMKSLAVAIFLALLSNAALADGYNNFDCWDLGFGPQSLTTGSHNTSCGQGNLTKITSGSFNAAFGTKLGVSLTTGSNNVFIGSGCDAPTATTSNYLCIATSSSTIGISGNIVAGGALRFAGESVVATDISATTTTLTNITGLTATLEAAKTYRFESELHFDADATGGHKYAIAGTATATAIKYQVTTVCNATNNLVISSRQTALAGSVGQAGCVAGYTKINGTITSNAAGTLTVQFAQNAAGGTSSVLRGSTFVVREVQ